MELHFGLWEPVFETTQSVHVLGCILACNPPSALCGWILAALLHPRYYQLFACKKIVSDDHAVLQVTRFYSLSLF